MGGSKQNEGREPAPVSSLMERCQRRERMKHADRLFLPEAPVDVPEDVLVVADERWDVMHMAIADRVPSVVPEIMDEQVETVGEQGPEGIVGIDRKTRCRDSERAAGRPDCRAAGRR